MQPPGTWPCCGIKPTEIGWMRSIDPATADRRCWRASSDNHRELPPHLALSPPPTAHCHCHCYSQCLLHRGSWVGCGEQPETLVARLRFSWSRRFFFGAFDSSVCLSVLTICTPSLGIETELQSAVSSQQPHHLAHPSSVIYHHATQGDTGRGQTAPKEERSWLV